MRPLTISPRADAVSGWRKLSGLSEGQARGGGSRSELPTDASSLTGAETSIAVGAVWTELGASLLGNSAADDDA